MGYTKQTWTTGETITAQKLNHMEDGIAESVGMMVVPVSVTYENNIPTYATDVAYTDVIAALKAGKLVFYRLAGEMEGGAAIDVISEIMYNSAETFVVARNLYHTADGITTEEPSTEDDGGQS